MSKKEQAKQKSVDDFIERIEKILNIKLVNYQREFLKKVLIARARGNGHSLIIPVVLKGRKNTIENTKKYLK